MGLFYGHYYFDKYKTKKSNLTDINVSIVLKSINRTNFKKILTKSQNVINGSILQDF